MMKKILIVLIKFKICFSKLKFVFQKQQIVFPYFNMINFLLLTNNLWPNYRLKSTIS